MKNNNINNLLKSNGFSVTKPRVQIIKILQNSNSPIGIDAIINKTDGKYHKQQSSPINSPRPAPAGTSGHTKEKPDLTHSQDPHSEATRTAKSKHFET